MSLLKRIGKILMWLAVIDLALFAFFLIDWGFLGTEITSYSAQCSEQVISGRCSQPAFPANPTTFKVDLKGQNVIYWTGDFPVQRLHDCAVVNRTNWTCKYSDGSAELGFKNGNYFSHSIGTPTELSRDYDAREFQLSRFEYVMWQYFEQKPKR